MFATPQVAGIGGAAFSSPEAPAAAPAAPGTPAARAAGPAVVLLLIDARQALWAWSRLVRGPGALRKVPGLRFAKVLGSGHEGGFGLRPSATRQGLFCVFDSSASATAFVQASPVVAAYRDHAREFCSVTLHPYASRGSWDGMSLPVSTAAPVSGPIAALTRASIRPLRSAPFWRLTPAAQQAMADTPGCRLAVGLGEAPLLRQATFSIWDSLADMNHYARQGAHLEAIRASQQQGYFSESMFVRFVPEGLQGCWKGRHLG